MDFTVRYRSTYRKKYILCCFAKSGHEATAQFGLYIYARDAVSRDLTVQLAPPPLHFKKCEKRASSRISAYCRYHWRDTRIFKTVLLFQVFSHFELCAPFPTLAEFLIKSPCPELYSIIMASHSLHKHRETESGARLRRKKEAY